MTSETEIPADGLLLTREELAIATQAVGGTELPGAGPETPEPEGGTNPAAMYGERSLRARGLARLDPDGYVTLAPAVIRAVMVCTHALQSLWLFRMSPGMLTQQAFGYIGQDAVVLHTKPEPGLHRLTHLAGTSALIDELIDLAGCALAKDEDARQVLIPDALLSRARDIAASRDIGGAAAALLDGGMESDEAEAIATTLAGAHGVSVFVHLVPQPDGNFARQEITVLSGDHGAWVMVQEPEGMEGSSSLEQIDRAGLDTLLHGWLDQAAEPASEERVSV